jgi:hypothetical protein
MEFPNHNIALLTHDTNPLLTAKRCDLACEVIPDDWLLDPEPDPRDRQINELRNRIDKLQKKCPNIDATWISEDGDETKCLSISMVEFESLDDIQIDELINIVKKRYPMKTDFPKKEKYTQLPLDLKNIKSFDSLKDQSPKYKPPSAYEITNYQENKYPDWLALVEKHLRNLSSRLEDPFRFFSFFLSLSNNGNYPAENIVIEFKIFGGLNFWPFERGIKDQESNKIPSQPIPPKGKWVTSNSIYEASMKASMKFAKPWQYPQNNILKDSFLNQIPDFPKPRDKNSFYWKSEKSKNTLTAGCEEFRHQVNSEIFELTVAMPTSEKGIEKCKVECIISAKNMVNPIKKYLDLIIFYNEGDTWGEAKKLLSSI